SEGTTVSPRRSDAMVGALVRRTQAVAATLTAASTASVVRCFVFILLLRLRLGRGVRWLLRQRPPRPAYSEGERDDANRDRHDADVERRHQVLEVVDITIECELYVAQLRTDREHLAAEAFDGLALLGREHIVGAFRRLRQLRQLLLGLLKLIGQLLLFGAEL